MSPLRRAAQWGAILLFKQISSSRLLLFDEHQIVIRVVRHQPGFDSAFRVDAPADDPGRGATVTCVDNVTERDARAFVEDP